MAHTIKKQEPAHVRDITPHYEEHELDSPRVCEHYFEFVTSESILCKKCHIGFYVGVGDRLKDGHLYHGSELVI